MRTPKRPLGQCLDAAILYCEERAKGSPLTAHLRPRDKAARNRFAAAARVLRAYRLHSTQVRLERLLAKGEICDCPSGCEGMYIPDCER